MHCWVYYMGGVGCTGWPLLLFGIEYIKGPRAWSMPAETEEVQVSLRLDVELCGQVML